MGNFSHKINPPAFRGWGYFIFIGNGELALGGSYLLAHEADIGDGKADYSENE